MRGQLHVKLIKLERNLQKDAEAWFAKQHARKPEWFDRSLPTNTVVARHRTGRFDFMQSYHFPIIPPLKFGDFKFQNFESLFLLAGRLWLPNYWGATSTRAVGYAENNWFYAKASKSRCKILDRQQLPR